MNAGRYGTALGLAAVLSMAAGSLATGCIRAPWKDVSESAVTLHLTCTVGYVVDTTAIVALSVVPDAPGSLTVPTSATVKVNEAAGSGSSSVTPVTALGGFRLDGPLLVHDRGRPSISLGLGQGDTLRLLDGYGNFIQLAGLSFTFDHTGRGVTNLPTDATIVVPMAGAPFSLASASISGLAPGLPVSYSVTSAGNVRLTDSQVADAHGVAVFGTMPTSLAGDISNASVTFGE
jgi:hypothetical protein